jgi:hypothetical protein
LLEEDKIMVVGSLHTQRIISAVAATLIALACGTNVGLTDGPCFAQRVALTVIQYAYSAWAHQFAEKMHLSSKAINLLVGGIRGSTTSNGR